MFGVDTPVDGLNFSFVVSPHTMYVPESAKNASSAVTRLRRSDFIAAVYAFVFVFANFGIAIAARMPMITTTIRSSISVKPRRVELFMGLVLFGGGAASPSASWDWGMRRFAG